MLRPPRPKNSSIINRLTFTRYMLTGTYVGVATVLGMVWWFTMYEDGPLVQYEQLFGWALCDENSEVNCAIFHDPSPNTMSLSVLVTIEMFCALNSISETNSLFSSRAHPFMNPHLIGAIVLSFSLHMVILYVPFFAAIFSVTPLTWVEWKAVLVLSAPVLLLDEILKFVDRLKSRLLLCFSCCFSVWLRALPQLRYPHTHARIVRSIASCVSLLCHLCSQSGYRQVPRRAQGRLSPVWRSIHSFNLHLFRTHSMHSLNSYHLTPHLSLSLRFLLQ
jgi:Cation transporting ATPase, C-terminus